MSLRHSLLLALVGLASCTAAPPLQQPPDSGMLECEVTAPTSCESPALRYADVKPIFEQQCVVCHAGALDGPWPLTEYEFIYDWKDDIRGDMLNCSMPPYDGGVPMPLDQRETLLQWIRCDMPQ